MNPVIQEDRTGCGIASVAAITGKKYSEVRIAAAQIGISVTDPTLWSDTKHIRKLLTSFGVIVGAKEEPFRSWESLPSLALLAIKWHLEKSGPAWHWVVFTREGNGIFVLDPKRGLQSNRRTDFGRMKPKWFIRVNQNTG
jgi:ABC-type bacteriocin/lantibiotic exporter with double-glycine peptidase domain